MSARINGDTPHYVYAVYDGDADTIENLLYIGCTSHPERREKELRRCKFSGRPLLRFVVLAVFRHDRRAAYRYENELIRDLCPPHNVQGNPEASEAAA